MNVVHNATIRQVLPDEGPLLNALAFRAKAFWGYSAEFMAACEDELTQLATDFENQWFGVADSPQGVAGFYAVRKTSPAVMDLAALFVEPAFIRQGVGRTLFKHAVSRARFMGATSMTIQSDPHAEGFYCAMGATRIGEEESCSVPGRMLPLLRFDLAEGGVEAGIIGSSTVV